VPGALETVANGINDAGQVVGYYGDISGTHGFLLDVDGSYTTIDLPGARETIPSGINDAGQIVGSYVDAGGTHHGFLATPK
jgi:probable HAF family extracellular repeat protein